MMRERMAAVSKITLSLLCCFVISFADAHDCKFVAVGDSFMVPLTHLLKGTEKIRWFHNSTVIVDRRTENSVHKFNKGSEADIYSNGSLKLTNVEKKHNGIYKPELFTSEGRNIEISTSIKVCVQDRVPAPKMETKCALPNVKFTCALGKSIEGVTYEWLRNEKLIKEEKKESLIRKAKDVATDVFKCSVSNKVSSATSTPATQNCYKKKFSLPEKFLGLNIWIFVGGGAGIVLLLIIVVIVCCVRARRRESMQMREEEELRLEWTKTEKQNPNNLNPPHDHPHNQHPHHKQQPAGQTGPRQHRPKHQREQPHPRTPNPPNGQPQASPRRPAQLPRPPVNNDDEQPPPLPQPRKKAPRTQRM